MMTAEHMMSEHTLSGLLRDYCSERIRQDIRVSGLALDSRKVQAGDLFLATSDETIQEIRQSREQEQPETDELLAVYLREEDHDENRYQQDAEDGQEVGNVEHRRLPSVPDRR